MLAYYFGLKQLRQSILKQARAAQARELYIALTDLCMQISLPEFIPADYATSDGKRLGDAINHITLTGTVEEINVIQTVLSASRCEQPSSLGRQPDEIERRIFEMDQLRLRVLNGYRRDMGLSEINKLPPIHLYSWRLR